MTVRFEQIWMAGGHAAKGIAGTNFRDRALVAIDATVVSHLEKQGAVPEPVTAFDTLCTSDAQPLVNCVFVIRILHERAFYGRRRAQAVLRAGIEIIWFRLKKTGA